MDDMIDTAESQVWAEKALPWIQLLPRTQARLLRKFWIYIIFNHIIFTPTGEIFYHFDFSILIVSFLRLLRKNHFYTSWTWHFNHIIFTPPDEVFNFYHIIFNHIILTPPGEKIAFNHIIFTSPEEILNFHLSFYASWGNLAF